MPTIVFWGSLSLLSGCLASGQETQDAYKLGRDAQQGKKINPVPLNLQGRSAQRAYLGSYLVNGHGGCNSCHTCPAYKASNPYKLGGSALPPADDPGPINTANFMAGGTPFPGRGTPFQGSTLTSPNLTPDSSGRPGGMTFEDFRNAMQNGEVSKKPGHVLLVMPWPVYRHLYDNDLRAIYAYLSSIPSASPGTCTGDGQTGN
ncbi:MAG TPA: hypothetical protein VH601_02375 [Bryobacteraceae bacterium]